MGTKLRARYQRSRGRDLFDLWLVLTAAAVDPSRVATAFNHYMGDEAFTYPQLAANLSDKLLDRGFGADLTDLIKSPPEGYDVAAAADIVMKRLGSQLAGAPSVDGIALGEWRS